MAKSQIKQYIFTPGIAYTGIIKFPGRVDLSQILLITNTTTNTLIYNFADTTYSGTQISFTRANDSVNFPHALDNTDGYTTMILAVDTSMMNSTDALQIFYEKSYVDVRMPEIGTDAFERTRTANPQSMLDADFEYGLQPTKWLTISQQRGYPAIYEIPGTDITVSAATTDASTLQGGISTAESIITITTVTAHGYNVGGAFTIKGVNSAITGFERAEGSFIVYSVPTITSFQYIAQGKVGYNNGDNIWTASVQLRQGGFYTGANINAIINIAITGTSSIGNTVTVANTTGLTIGSQITLGQVVTNAVATNLSNNSITLGTTLGLTPGMPLYFTGTNFGSIIGGTTYYVRTIIDNRNITMSTDSGGTVAFAPTTALNGNMYVTAGSTSVGGLIANTNTPGTVYYITSIPSAGTPGTITVSQNIQYTTTITATNSTNNGVKFTNYTYLGVPVSGTFNMTVGETVTITGSQIGNLTAGTYYVIQILDGNYATLSTTLSGSVFIQSTSTGTMTAVVGVNVTLTTATGYMALTAVCQPTVTVTTPATVASFTASLTGNQLIVTGITSGTLAAGQGISLSVLNTVPSSTAILSQSSGTTGGIGTYTVSTSTGSVVSNNTFISVATAATITVNTYSPHGLIPGDTITMAVTSDTGFNNHTLTTGPFFVESVSSSTINNQTLNNIFTFTARGNGIINTSTTILLQLYARPDSFFQHRPLDGGVQLGTSTPSYGSQAIRMSKKYIRYQSGKGINFNTGLLMAPNYYVRAAYANGTAIGSTVTIVTDDVDHGCQVGATFTLSGVSTSGYNGSYTISNIVDERTIQFIATNVLGSTQGVIITDPCLMSLTGWVGATIRSGTFDEQNGVFFQFDGQTVAVVKRSSTFQLAGTMTALQGSGQIVGVNTRFTAQLWVGAKIVIRGMSHTVTQVVNDNLIYVNPQWRGFANVSGIKGTRTIDYIVPQNKWNIDRCDGAGGPYNPSGYKIDVSKMQMAGMQWTWYGAGFIDWMLRGPEGKFITVHRLRNNNLNNEAWMRTGNIAVRFEVINEAGINFLASALGSSDTSLTLGDVTSFSDTGYVYIDNEFIRYTGRNTTTNQLTGLTRGVVITPWVNGSVRTFTAGSAASHILNTGVIQVACTASPVISHWGAAFVQDGGFDTDRSYLFNYQVTNVALSTKKTTAFAIRLAPSVSNALTGDLGARELINRASFLLQQLDSSSGTAAGGNAAVVIEGIINPGNMPSTNNIQFNSLNSTVNPTGQPSFSQVAPGSSMVFQNAVNNYLVCPIYLLAGTTNIPLTTNPATQSPAVAITDDIYFPQTTNALYGLTRVSALLSNSAVFSSTINTSTTVSITSGSITGTTLTFITGSGTLQAGMVITGTGIAANTYLVAAISGGGLAGSTWTVSVSQTITSGTAMTATLYQLSATVTSGTILVGSLVTGGTIAAGIYIAGQTSGTTGGTGVYYLTNISGNTPASGQNPTGTTYYGVTINQLILNAVPVLATGSTVNLSRNTFAQPGETVFSYINSPANKDSLDLSLLKELTNTPIGGRGCYPNGCDIMFVNAYITQGAPINQNLVLRWGEAQA